MEKQKKRIFYPTLVDHEIHFFKAQGRIKLFNIAGSKILEFSNENPIESLSVSHLNAGMYFILFDDSIVEKIIIK